MAVSGIVARYNWFLCIGIPLLLVFYKLRMVIHSKRRSDFGAHKLHRQMLLFFGCLCCAVLSIGIMLEVYHFKGCPNSKAFHKQTEQLAQYSCQVLDDLNIPFWLCFGNLLFALRGQETIPSDDSDSDLAILYTNETMIQNLVQSLKRNKGYTAKYNQERNLIQVYGQRNKRGAHADIWIYKNTTGIGGSPAIENADYTVGAPTIDWNWVFPLTRRVTFLGREVYLPFQAERLAMTEYGSNYLTPMKPRLACIENFLNGFCYHQDGLGKVLFVIYFGILSTTLYYFLVHKTLPSCRTCTAGYLPVRTSSA